MRRRSVVAMGLLALAALAGCFRHEPPAADWARCAVNSDCVLAADSCCGVCGAPGLDDVDGVNRTLTDEHFHDVCPAPVPCPECPSATNPDLLATCDSLACAAVDIRQHAASACVADTDCRLRTTGCCECGGATDPSSLIAIAVTGEPLYSQLVCDPAAACPDCVPIYPTDVEAFCATDGHCDIRPVAGCADCAAMGLTCCDGACVATYNDIFNCGACGVVCSGATPYGDGTTCTTPPCTGAGCTAPEFCCDATCCAAGDLCCFIPGPGPTAAPRCTPPEAGTCPIGCPTCR